MISRALDRTSGNRHAAAKLLGIDIATLERGLAEHRLGTRAGVEDADGER
jgi:transcriptional regulator with PAS, ATPase and Fis domain